MTPGLATVSGFVRTCPPENNNFPPHPHPTQPTPTPCHVSDHREVKLRKGRDRKDNVKMRRKGKGHRKTQIRIPLDNTSPCIAANEKINVNLFLPTFRSV